MFHLTTLVIANSLLRHFPRCISLVGPLLNFTCSISSKFVFLLVGRSAVCAMVFYVPENYSSPCPICRRWPEHTPLHYAASHVNRHFWKFLKVRNHFIIKLSENYLAPYAADGPSTLHRFSWLNNSSCCLIPALSKKTPICHLMS